MKKKIIYGLLFAVAMVTASSSFVSCKDYEGDDYAHWQEGLAANGFNDRTSLKEIIAFQIKTLRYELTNALGNSDNGNYTDAQIQQWLADLAAIENGLPADPSVSQLIAALNDLNKLASSASIVNESLKGIRYAWSDSLKAAFDTASMAYHKADSALALAIRDSMRNDTLSNRIDTLTKRADSLFQRANELADSALKKADSILNARIDSLKKNDSAMKKTLDSLIAAKDTTDSVNNARLDSIYNWLNTLNPEDSLEYTHVDENGDTVKVKKGADNIGDIIKAFNEANGFLQSQIDDLYSLVDRLQKDVEKLQKDLDNLFGALKKQITGIIVQGTYSPVFGYGSLPLGVQTNILSAYVGNVQIAGGKFPSFNSGNYASEKCIFTEGDIQYLSGVATEAVPEGILMNEEDGNAGYMYLTVNPTNIDFTGTDFFLVNSKGDESRIKLSKLEASDDELTFGWTRGTSVGKESPNGFYKVVATIDKGDAKNMQPKFDKAGFKQAVKAATEGQKRMAVKEVAKALFNSLQSTSRFGVKAEWVDTITTKDKAAKRSVTSAYDIAALSIEPLGFGFKSLDGVIKLPTIDAKVIAEDMHVTLTMGDIKVTPKDGSYKVTTNIHLVEFNQNIIKFNELTGKYEFVGDASTYEIVTVGGKDISILNKDQLVNLFRQGDVIEIDVTDFVKEIYGEFNKELEKIDFSGTTANLNKQIDKIANTVNSYIDRANGWINRFNNLFAHLSNALQPVLLWSDGESSGELGGIVSANYVVGKPVKAGSKLCLIPTTYSLELFAPAYKKSLLVTNAYDLKTGDSAQKGNADLKAAADALSNQLTKYASYKSTPSLNKDNMIEINVGNKTGVTYEIAYTALDYEGKVAGRKFYITVVE